LIEYPRWLERERPWESPGRRDYRSRVGLLVIKALLFQDLVTEVDALVTNEHVRAGDDLLDKLVRFLAKAAMRIFDGFHAHPITSGPTAQKAAHMGPDMC
jgi:hypothetical protein